MNATILKRWFKQQFDIPVRVERSSRVYILPNKTENHRDPITYNHQFPWDLGQKCLKLRYPESSKLVQDWCGNIHPHQIVMTPPQWAIIMQMYNDEDNALLAQIDAESKGATIDDIRPADRFF